MRVFRILHDTALVGFRRVVYQDDQGRKWLRGIPEDLPDSQAAIGIPLGPPSLEDLELPLDLEVRLHNQLFDRDILTETDARKRLAEVVSAVQAALRVDANRILAIYQGHGAVNGKKKSPEDEPVSNLHD